jgi:hypothetical protein
MRPISSSPRAHARARAHAAIAAVAAWAACTALPALACTLQSTPLGPRMTDCNLRAFSDGQYDLDISTVIDTRPRLLPNLVPQDLGFFVNGNLVDVDLTVRNTASIANAGAFDLGPLLWLANPLAGGATVPGTPAYGPVVRANPLPRASSRGYRLRTVTLPNRMQDWDVCVAVTVDPPPSGGPAQGKVPESNEDDNVLQRCCRVYGPNPDVTGPPACQ